MPAKKKVKIVRALRPAKQAAKRRTAIPATMPRTSSKPVNMRIVIPAPDRVELPHNLIAKRAFEIWEMKLRLANDSVRNWLEAESQLRA